MGWRHLFVGRPPATATGENVYIRPPLRQDFREWAALRKASREFLQPWEPVWSQDELSRAAFKARLRKADSDLREGNAFTFFIFDRKTHLLVGGISLGHVRYGVSMSGQIGYWMGEPHAGKGLMQDAVQILVRYGFETVGLHRLEAACIPGNLRSVRVLENTGFVREGLLKSYLKINGQWQDHLLFARISGVTDERQKAVDADGR
ncbi:MAG: GNAT family protein [Rhizobiaceae bacterium]